MKIIILGSNGILGGTLFHYLKIKKKLEVLTISRNKKSNHNINLSNFSDFKKLENEIIKNKPDYLINCIGVTKFNNSYNNKKITNILNTKMPIHLANFCELHKIYFLHISTDCVFTGKKGNYSENMNKDSIDLYGYSKNKGEIKNKFSTTIRTSFIGPEVNSNKSLLNWFLSQTKTVKGYKNAFFSGLTSLELSKIIFTYFIQKNLLINKIINVGSSRISKLTLLNKIKKIFKKDIKIISYSKFKIDRSLNSKKFKKLTGYKIKKWNKMLIELRKFMIKNKYKLNN
tara:strand:- start:772 stop:1629 length:858 start_codon:yes stop_codon:yes gene_type:complete